MRVDLVVPGSLETPTGGYIYDRHILRELERLGCETSVLLLDRSFPQPTAAALTDAKEMLSSVEDGRILIIDGLALAGLLPLLPDLRARVQPIALIHHPLADETGITEEQAAALEANEKAALALVPRIIVTSRWTRRRLGDYGIEANRIAVVEPGIDRPEARRRQRSGVLRLLTVGTVTPRKGHALLIESLARLQRFDWSLRLAGSIDADADCFAALTTQIDAVGLSDRIGFLGVLSADQVRDEYQRADCFVLPSYLEGFGMALAEAVAFGLPVISTTAGAIPDTVPESASCLVPPGDVDALTGALERVLEDPRFLDALARGAREASARWPTWADSGRAFAACLGEAA